MLSSPTIVSRLSYLRRGDLSRRQQALGAPTPSPLQYLAGSGMDVGAGQAHTGTRARDRGVVSEHQVTTKAKS